MSVLDLSTQPGLTGDATCYSAQGTTGSNTITTNATTIAVGTNLLICDGGPSLSLGLPMTTFTQPPTFVLGGVVGSITLPTTINLTSYDHLRFVLSAVDDGSKTFKDIPGGGLWVNLYDTNGVLQSSTTTTAGIASAIFAPFSLDHRGNLTAIASITFTLTQIVNINNQTLNQLGIGQTGSLVPTSGVGFILTVQAGQACTDLRTTVTTVAPASGGLTLTLSAPLETTLRIEPVGVTGYVGSVNIGMFRDETAALQAALVKAGNGSEISFPPGFRIPVSETIVTFGLQGQKWSGQCSVGGAAASYGAPGLLWIGACGQPLLSLNRSRDFTFKDLVFYGNGFHEPMSEVEIDMTGTGPVITTNHHFKRCMAQGPWCFPNHACFAIGRTATANCEFMVFDDCWAQASSVPYQGGSNYYIGYNPNSKSILFRNCKAYYGQYTVYGGNGSFQWDCGSDEYPACSFYINNSTEPIRIYGHNSEYALQAVCGNNYQPLATEDCRWSAMMLLNNAAPFSAGASAIFILKRNKIQQQNLTGGTVSSSPLVSALKGTSTRIFCEGNSWQSWSKSSLSSLEIKYGGYVSIMDQFTDGITPMLMQSWVNSSL